MGAKERQIILDSIREISEAGMHEIERGKVEAVNLTDYTIDVEISEGVTIHDVRLTAVLNSNLAVIEVPKVGSYVVIAKMEAGVEYVLVKASAIDKWLLKIENTTFEIDSSLIKANGGNNHGMVKVVNLTEKLNAIETKVNGIIAALKSTSVVLAPSGAYPLTTNPAIAGLTNLTATQKDQLENDKFLH